MQVLFEFLFNALGDGLWILLGFFMIGLGGTAFVAVYDLIVTLLARFRQET